MTETTQSDSDPLCWHYRECQGRAGQSQQKVSDGWWVWCPLTSPRCQHDHGVTLTGWEVESTSQAPQAGSSGTLSRVKLMMVPIHDTRAQGACAACPAISTGQSEPGIPFSDQSEAWPAAAILHMVLLACLCPHLRHCNCRIYPGWGTLELQHTRSVQSEVNCVFVAS